MFSFNTANAPVSNLEPLNFFVVYAAGECIRVLSVCLGSFPRVQSYLTDNLTV